MADEEQTGAIEITINGQRFRVADRPASGAELREVAMPPLSEELDLLQMTATPGESDLFIDDDEVVDFENGASFITVPRKILAG